MQRIHLFEIGELAWCPRAVRDGLTDYLTFMIERGHPYALAAPLLAEAMRRMVEREGKSRGNGAADALTTEPLPREIDVVDLASGAGGPWQALVTLLANAATPVHVRLTDRHPNLAAYARLALATSGRVTGDPRPISADAVPADLAGFRTMFSAFHHFAPADARRVLTDAMACGTPVGIFEATRRDVRAMLLMCLTPLFVLLTTPFIRPFRWSRLLLTYVVPVIPLAVMFDGVVSCLRTYTPVELRALAQESAPEGYAWTAGEIGKGPIPMTYLLFERATAPDAG